MCCTGVNCHDPQRDVLPDCKPLEHLAKLIQERGIKNVPIVDDDGRPVGLLTARDILRALLRDAEYEEALLIDYVKGIGYR